MEVSVRLYSEKKGELNRFLSQFYNTDFEIENQLDWEKKYANPIELAEIIGTYIDNSDDYIFQMLICLDKDLFVRVTPENGDAIIRYLYERYPY